MLFVPAALTPFSIQKWNRVVTSVWNAVSQILLLSGLWKPKSQGIGAYD
jgi:hypothetical protein